MRSTNTTLCEEEIGTPSASEEYTYNNEEDAVRPRSKTEEHIVCDLWDDMNRIERVHCASERQGARVATERVTTWCERVKQHEKLRHGPCCVCRS